MVSVEQHITLRLDSATGEVVFDGAADGDVADLAHVVMASGGLPSPDGFVMPVLAFRRAAVDIAAQLRDLGGRVELEAAVERLLRTHLDEIRARRAAESDDPLEPAAVLTTVAGTNRFDRALTTEQVRDLRWLLRLRHGANFSVPGAGKTAAALAIYEALRGEGAVDRLLVVAPKNAFLAWEDETARCYGAAAPQLSRLTGGRDGVAAALAADPEIALVSYQLLPNVSDLVTAWARRHTTHVVLDESHRVKGGHGGVIAAAALALSEIAVRRDILSGTPLPQAPEDLRGQLDFLWPGHRIMPDLRVVAEAPETLLEEVERAVRPLYVRTTKDELGLPPLSGPRPLLIELGPLQRELYEVLRSEAARAAAGIASRDRQFFRLLGRHVVRLLQAAVNPMLLTQGALVDRAELELPPEGVRAWELLRDLARFEQPAKVARAVERADEVVNDGGKVLIWSSFVLNLTSLEQLLARHNPVVLYGQVATGPADDPDTREGRILRFHEDDACRVMIANPAACGEGISLHRACHHAIYLDRSFNAAHFLQSVDRIHRLGLPPDQITTVEVIEARGTIDQRVSQRLAAKIEAMARILNDRGLAAMAYDPDDVIEEFPAGLEPEDVEEVIDHLVAEPGED